MTMIRLTWLTWCRCPWRPAGRWRRGPGRTAAAWHTGSWPRPAHCCWVGARRPRLAASRCRSSSRPWTSMLRVPRPPPRCAAGHGSRGGGVPGSRIVFSFSTFYPATWDEKMRLPLHRVYRRRKYLCHIRIENKLVCRVTKSQAAILNKTIDSSIVYKSLLLEMGFYSSSVSIK